MVARVPCRRCRRVGRVGGRRRSCRGRRRNAALVTRAQGVTAEAHRSVTGAPVWILPLGFTTPPLSLNDRGKGGRRGGYARAAKVRAIRTAVWTRGRQLRMTPQPHLHVRLHYVPNDRRPRDPDNLVATLKPAIDALTAMGADRGWICLSLVPDDTPEHVTWSPPLIHEPDEHGPRLWLEVTGMSAAPPPIG
jgi:crossover junction endodeoxyribonuclease RusA